MLTWLLPPVVVVVSVAIIPPFACAHHVRGGGGHFSGVIRSATCYFLHDDYGTSGMVLLCGQCSLLPRDSF